jgi:hypothetical protein
MFHSATESYSVEIPGALLTSGERNLARLINATEF